MSPRIHRVAVLGAGASGSGLAAHLANAGVPVLLLDAVSAGVARDGLERALRASPPEFFHRSLARLVTPGSLEDGRELLRDCELVIAAGQETLQQCRALFDVLEPRLAPGSIVAVSSSHLRVRDLLAGRSEDFRRRFLVMHFLPPARRTRLLEVVPGPVTEPGVVERAIAFARDTLGMGVLFARDTPHLIAERLAAHALLVCLQQMQAQGLAPGDAELLTGLMMGRETGCFRLVEDWGLDAFLRVVDRCATELPRAEDRSEFQVPALLRSGAGLPSEEARREGDAALRRALRPLLAVEAAGERLRKLVADEGRAGQFAWSVLARVLLHAARCVGEVAPSVVDVDEALTRGFQWGLGPFELWDALGVAETAGRMRRQGLVVPEPIERMLSRGVSRFYAADGAAFDLERGECVPRRGVRLSGGISLPRREAPAPVLSSPGAEAVDIGDGVLALSFKTKHNSIDAEVVAMLGRALERAEADFRALVIANPGPHFSVGANLMLVTMWASRKRWEDIRGLVSSFQAATQRLKYARVPVVAAPLGRTLGGGLELCLAATAVHAATETQAGLVETEIGLVPGGGGTLNLLWRALQGIPEGVAVDAFPYVEQVFRNIARATVSTSAVEAQHLGYFRLTDGVSFHPERQLAEARARALGLAGAGYRPPVPRAFRLPGESGIRALEAGLDELLARGQATAHDVTIGRKLAAILCGGHGSPGREVTEAEVLELEQEAFVSLCGEPRSQERMQSLLMNKRPLRN